MRVWRLLVEVGQVVWTFVVAASDHTEAWEITLGSLPRRQQRLATLEELEATSGRNATGVPRVIHSWRTAGPPRRGADSERLVRSG